MLIKETRSAIWLLNLLLCIVQVPKGLCRPLPVLSLCLSDAGGGGAIELVLRHRLGFLGVCVPAMVRKQFRVSMVKITPCSWIS